MEITQQGGLLECCGGWNLKWDDQGKPYSKHLREMKDGAIRKSGGGCSRRGCSTCKRPGAPPRPSREVSVPEEGALVVLIGHGEEEGR